MPGKKEKQGFVIARAEQMGLCSGSRRAIKLVEEAAAKNGEITSLGAIVHNPDVVNELIIKGVHPADSLDKIKSNTVAVTSHGVGPDIIAALKTRKKQIVDTTCPNVQNTQHTVKELVDNGFQVIIFGDASHPEVKGLAAWANNQAIITIDSKELNKVKLPKYLGIISQTTQSLNKYTDFVKDIFTTALPDIKELRVYNTLCKETIRRQDAALELAKKSDVVIVIGGLKSANTRRLADICSEVTETHLIETAGEIDPAWLKGKKNIGITAGASTPDATIQKVIDRLESLR
jgi:4-hydroxy-3-methylbut-2-enyl diphosphate reductase